MSTVALTANRAAVSAKNGYWWINLIGLALSVMIARMSIGAYETAGYPDKAWICVTCQALAIALAIVGRRAFTSSMPWAGAAAGLGAAGCAWWAAHGLALAWSQGGDSTNQWMVFFLAALEAALFLLAEHVKEGQEALRIAAEKDAQEQAEELARIRARQDARERQDKPYLATAGGIALAALPGVANAGDMALNIGPIGERSVITSTNVGYADAHEHALALKKANRALTQEEGARLVGRPRSTIGKWWRDAGLAGREQAA